MSHDYHAIRAYMSERYPAAFTPRGTPPRPLRIGIHQEVAALLQEQSFPFKRKHLTWFMHVWTRRHEYRAVLIEGAARVDLLGYPAGTVTADQERSAKESYKFPWHEKQRQRAASGVLSSSDATEEGAST